MSNEICDKYLILSLTPSILSSHAQCPMPNAQIIMTSQWNAFLKNIGEWEGSFSHLSPQGEFLKDTKSFLCLEGLNENRTIRLTLCLGESKKVIEPIWDLVPNFQV